MLPTRNVREQEKHTPSTKFIDWGGAGSLYSYISLLSTFICSPLSPVSPYDSCRGVANAVSILPLLSFAKRLFSIGYLHCPLVFITSEGTLPAPSRDGSHIGRLSPLFYLLFTVIILQHTLYFY